MQMIKFPLFEPLLVWALATKLVPIPQSLRNQSGLVDVFNLTPLCCLCWLVLLVVAAVAAYVHMVPMYARACRRTCAWVCMGVRGAWGMGCGVGDSCVILCDTVYGQTG